MSIYLHRYICNVYNICNILHRCNYYIRAEDESKEMKIAEGALQGPEHGTVLKGALEQVPSPPRGSCDAQFYMRDWNLQERQGLIINKIAFELKSL